METKCKNDGISIVHNIASTTGGRESSTVELIANVFTGTTELVISKTITETYPITDYHKVMDLYNNLNSGGGRKLWTLQELTK
jgi:hypothetical protein